MQTLDVQNPDLPDLQFILMVLALSTSDLDTLNIPGHVRETLFDRCWVLLHETPPPLKKEERLIDLRQGDDVTLDAMVAVIRRTFDEYNITQLTWDHPPSAPTQTTTPEAQPLIDRLQKLYPTDSNNPSTPE
ncbi:MAG: hypothetical protein MRJ96_01240 [Nitrospirales bacterium]|nr:hypothetical protein [Nitrospira sp.]MDR4500067.1 hypothetical protein [Nitrospirales bacterium]